MSYCRWSSNDFSCDLYCYEGHGYITHVASNRVVGKTPKVPPISDENWVKAHNEQLDWLATANRERINLEHAGDTFVDYSLEAFKERLLYLRSLGYRFPEYVIERIDQEMKDGERSPTMGGE
jgi:hypothetical protein